MLTYRARLLFNSVVQDFTIYLRSEDWFLSAQKCKNLDSFSCTLAQSLDSWLYFMSDSLWTHGLPPTRLLCPRDSPGKNIGVGCHTLLQGIFLTQGPNPCVLHLLHYRRILYHWTNYLLSCTLRVSSPPPPQFWRMVRPLVTVVKSKGIWRRTIHSCVVNINIKYRS